jgi:hypothetical protein
MKFRLLKNLKFSAAYTILISAFIVTSFQLAHADTLLLFLSPTVTFQTLPVDTSRILQQKKLKVDEKGDLLIQYGGARFTVAYNDPTDQLKPTEQQQYPKRDRTAAINGISLTASMSF